MTPRAEKLSEAAGYLGLAIFAGALYCAFPGYVALGFVGIAVALFGVGARGLRDALWYGAAGVAEVEKQEQEAPPT